MSAGEAKVRRKGGATALAWEERIAAGPPPGLDNLKGKLSDTAPYRGKLKGTRMKRDGRGAAFSGTKGIDHPRRGKGEMRKDILGRKQHIRLQTNDMPESWSGEEVQWQGRCSKTLSRRLATVR